MKQLALALIVVTISAPLTLAQRRKQPQARDTLIQSRYDKFSDVTRVSITGHITLRPDLFFVAGFTYRGSQPTESVEGFNFLITGSPYVWGSLRPESLATFLPDNQQPSVSILLKHSSTIRTQKHLFMSYTGTLDAADFQRMVCADVVETRIGMRESTIPKRDLIKLRALLVVAGRRCVD